jgi:tRNA-2-methylthio-N6-dimethylallyladenosine synthase
MGKRRIEPGCANRAIQHPFFDIMSAMDYTKKEGVYAGYVKKLIADSRPGYMIKTFGCQMNESDSEKLAGLMEQMGYRRRDDEKSCHVILFNTCCVRESAEQKVFGHLGEMKKLKRENPDLVVGLCGCMMQQKGMADKIKKSYPYVDIIFGTNSMHRLPMLLHKVLTGGKKAFEVSNGISRVVEGAPSVREDEIKAYVPIMHGCDNFCSYCIVPYVRGRERSREPEDIVNEVKVLVADGVKEITLLGQNVNSYDGGLGFASLLGKVAYSCDIRRIRFMTSHPKDIDEDVMGAIRDNENICDHLHLPIQSGSTRILARMSRNYTGESYLEKIRMVRETVPEIGLSTDIIVGFPGETEEDFAETLDVLEKVKFDFAFTFIYSKRKGTPAAKMEGEVPEPVKHERFKRLLEVQNRITLERNEKCVGDIIEVMVEGESRTDPGMLTGRTQTNRIVNFKADGGKAGDFAQVHITKAKTWNLEGELEKWTL